MYLSSEGRMKDKVRSVRHYISGSERESNMMYLKGKSNKNSCDGLVKRVSVFW